MIISKRILFILVGVVLFSCSSSFQKSPVDNIIRDMPKGNVFSIILHDMDVQGNFSNSYYHQYEIIKGNDNKLKAIDSEITDWMQVSEVEFNKYINNMGMEIAARDSTGKLTKEVAPPGYNNYVGNQKYGRWENRNGHSFWAFYGQYAFLSSMFRMSTYPVRRDYYNDWRSHHGSGKTYYGPGGSYYGTNNSYNRTRNSNSTWNSKSTAFKSNVRNRVSRSSGRSGKSSSSRSRGAGYGK